MSLVSRAERERVTVMSDIVLVERHGGAAVITLNLPERRNVLSADLVHAIGAAFDAVEADETVKCIVLTGAGKAFCAGAELPVLRAASEGKFDSVREVYDGFLRVLRSPLPVIAAVNGPAVGAGFNLALACKVRLAGKRASFDTRFAQLRLHPGRGHVWLLARAVGEQQAILATVFGEVWSAERAKEAGLVASVHEDETLLADAVALARKLDGQDQAFVRRLMSTVELARVTSTHTKALEQETSAQEWSTKQPAFATGLAAIEARITAGKRPPSPSRS